MEFHMINITYAALHMRAQTEQTTFSCKDDCTLTKHTWRWTYSALRYFSIMFQFYDLVWTYGVCLAIAPYTSNWALKVPRQVCFLSIFLIKFVAFMITSWFAIFRVGCHLFNFFRWVFNLIFLFSSSFCSFWISIVLLVIPYFYSRFWKRWWCLKRASRRLGNEKKEGHTEKAD